jgi:serine phosphatase RsbU (regulator of sigma subunit)
MQMDHDTLTIAVATRPHPHETLSGDLWTVQWAADGSCRLAVIDGLGHGEAAHEAARAAVHALAAAPDLAPERALALCQRPLAGTRGAAIAIARIAPAADRLTFAGIGNVEGRIWQRDGERRLLAQRGIVGAAVPTIRPVDFPLSADWLLILHSDGISDRFASAALPGWGGPAQPLADAILGLHGRATDDATVVIAAPHRGPLPDAAGVRQHS